jgi:hypothetical protein
VIRVGVGLGQGAAGLLAVGVGEGGGDAVSDGDGLPDGAGELLADAGGVAGSDGDGAAESDGDTAGGGDACGVEPAGSLRTNALLSTAVCGGEAQAALGRAGATAAASAKPVLSPAADQTNMPEPRMMHPAVAASAVRP